MSKKFQKINGYRFARIFHSSKNYYKIFRKKLHELKHTSDTISLTSIDPLKDFNPLLEELERGEKLFEQLQKAIAEGDRETEDSLKKEINEIYNECIKRRELYLRKKLEVVHPSSPNFSDDDISL